MAGCIAAMSLVLVIFASRTLVFNDVNHWTYDFLVNHGSNLAPDPNIVVVDFDDATFAALKQFPVSRSVVADVITKVAAGNPKVIGLDFLLSEKRTPSQDAAMSSALASAGNVIIASQSGSGGLPSDDPLPEFCAPDPAVYGNCREGAVAFAVINLPVDSDGFIRRFLLFSADKHASESFPLLIAESFRGKSLVASASSANFDQHRIAYAEKSLRTVLIGSWSPQPAQSISALRILHGDFDANSLRDKIVLIGQSSDAARDREFTPVFRLSTPDNVRIRLSGVQIHAAAIATLLNGSSIRPVPLPVLFAISFLLAFLTTWLLLTREPKHSLLLTIVMALVIYVTSQVLFGHAHVWLQFLAIELCMAMAIPLTLGYQFLQERLLKSEALAQREQVMGLFSRYVAPAVAKEIWDRRNEVVLAGEERVATVLFSDIRSFTALTAGKPSQTVLTWLNEYLTAMDEVISAEGGFLNKFIGDGLMVLFGVPLSHGVADDAVRALRCAVEMQRRVEALNRAHASESTYAALKIGVGLHTGPLTCGSVGSPNRLEYSVIGETVNLASRLESLTKDFKTDIVLSGPTWQQVRNQFDGFDDLGPTKVRGFDEPIPLYGIRVTANSLEKESLSLRQTKA